jgi:CheY-like chemotaxis protein/HPt (histidine-containing phosphotransfer) domain-containing protein
VDAQASIMQRNDHDFSALRSKKILLAEDVELNQYLAKHFLEARGLKVWIASNGIEALHLLNQGSFDCILMDIQMPVMDGIQTAKKIRDLQDPYKATIPIIALTANVHTDDIEKYKEAGMNDFLAKPFDESGLLLVILKNQKDNESFSQKNICTDQGPKNSRDMSKLYDLSIVQSVSGGDKAFIRKMILLFIETVPQNLAELSTALRTENWEQVGKMAHKLKSTVDSMGIKSIHADIREVETNAKQQKDLHEIPFKVEKIVSVIDLCIEQLMQEIA